MKTKTIWTGSIAVALLAGLLVWAVAPGAFFVLLSVGGIVLLLLSALAMVVTFRKAKRVSPLSLAIGMGLSVTIAVIYSLVTRSSPGAMLLMTGLFSGGLIGAGWGLTHELFIEGGAIRSRGNAWYLMVWALSLAIPQGLALALGRPPAFAMLLLFCGTGLVLGQSGLTLYRYFNLKPQLSASPLSL